MDDSICIEKEQKMISISICALISYQPIVSLINTIVNLFVSTKFIYDSLFCYLILLFIIIKATFVTFKHIKIDILFLTLFYLSAYLITYLFFNANRNYMFTNIFDLMGNPLYVLFILTFPGYIFARNISNYHIFNSIMYAFSIIVVILSALTFIVLSINSKQPPYMTFSYNMLVHTSFLLISFLKNKRILTGMVSMLGIFMIFIGGARGPIVIVLTVFIIYYIFRKERLIKKIFSLSTMSIVILLIYYNFNKILIYISNFTIDMGINSRTIKLIINNQFLNSSGRDIISQQQLDSFTPLGLGLYGDRVISDVYAHNLFVEILVQFGLIFGCTILGLIIYVIARGLLSKNIYIRDLMIVFITSGFLKLFLSGSYLNQEPCFYVLLGFGINAICEGAKGRRKAMKNVKPGYLGS